MLETLQQAASDHTVWVARPTRSLTWPEAKRWLCLISLIPLGSGVLFLWFGAPFVLPFAGLEIALLWTAFYYVHWQGQWREVIHLSTRSLVIERGRHMPTQREEFDPAWVQVELAQHGRWRPSSLLLRSHGRFTELGSFLTDGERQTLAKALINALKKSR